MESGLSLLVSVRCLACGHTYAKPAGGGTIKANPGCPKCGYVGWVAEEASVTEAEEQHRSYADPRPRRSDQAR